MPTEPTAGERGGLVARLRGLSRPMRPRPTGIEPRLGPIRGIRAVLFDIYGTLFISGSGDVGTHAATDSTAALAEALHTIGLPTDAAITQRGVELLHLCISQTHEQRQAEGVDWPEVDIRTIWRQVLDRLVEEGMLAVDESQLQGEAIERLAVEYEGRVNPVWPMPQLDQVLEELRQWVALGDLSLGIVSNAQFLTPLLFEALLGRPHQAFGFDEALCAWSYRHFEAKPATQLYQPVVDELGRRGISPEQTLYVGNDMRNDIWPSAKLGLRTALFAGDKRSLRLRERDADVAQIRPDLILTALPQLPTALRGP